RLRAVIVPTVAIEYAIARVDIALSMELGAAALADRLVGDRAFGELGAKRVGQNRNLLHLVLIDVGGLRSLVARVQQVGAFGRHGHGAIQPTALNRELADRPVVALRRSRSLAPHALVESIRVSGAWHDLNQLRGIAPGQGYILDHALVERLAGRT